MSQLVSTLQDLLFNWDQNKQIDVVVLDVAKAFDTVPHDKLLSKLQHYGINNNLHNWIRSFLKERMQQVIVDGEKSQSVPVESGMPQRTVLGPLLFLLYINNLLSRVCSQCHLFADDCLFYSWHSLNESQPCFKQ